LAAKVKREFKRYEPLTATIQAHVFATTRLLVTVANARKKIAVSTPALTKPMRPKLTNCRNSARSEAQFMRAAWKAHAIARW
jgi:hypothetical protein